MAERYVWSQYEEAMGFDRYSILAQDAELAGDAPYQITIPSRFRRSDEHKHLSAGRKPAQLTKKMGFEASVERRISGRRPPTASSSVLSSPTSSMIAMGFPRSPQRFGLPFDYRVARAHLL